MRKTINELTTRWTKDLVMTNLWNEIYAEVDKLSKQFDNTNMCVIGNLPANRDRTEIWYEIMQPDIFTDYKEITQISCLNRLPKVGDKIDFRGVDLSFIHDSKFSLSIPRSASGIIFSEVDWEAAKPAGMRCWYKNCRFSESSFKSEIFCGYFSDSSFEYSKFDYSSFRFSYFWNCKFKNCSFKHLPGTPVYFENCSFVSCNFQSSGLARSVFNNIRFEKCLFNKAHLDKVKFNDCILDNCKALNARLSEELESRFITK